MHLKVPYAPPTPETALSWRELYVSGCFVQRSFESASALRRLAQDRGINISLGNDVWEFWDEQGALRPIAFGLDAWTDHVPVDPNGPDTIAFREEREFRAWKRYEVERDHSGYTYPLYTPWQLLPLQEVAFGRDADLPVDLLIDKDTRERIIGSLKPTLKAQLASWRSLDDRWRPTLKLLVSIQNRFWPRVSGRVVLPWDPVTKERIDPMRREVAEFEPESVLARHELEPEAIATTYESLIEQGSRIEGGRTGFRAQGGDRWARLRQLAARHERRGIRGPARAAMDYYEAAEMLGRWWFQFTGMHLPGIDVVPYRRTTRPVHHSATPTDPWVRSREALHEHLQAHGLWPGRVHAIVEGKTEAMWVDALVEALLGWIPADLLVTDIHGSGGARTMEELIETVADYAPYAAFLVDDEGDMARYVTALVEAGTVQQDDVMMVDSSFEEENFSDAELTRVARKLAANPPGNRSAVKLKLTPRELREEHDRKRAAARKGEDPGLAGTLLELMRDPIRGPCNLKKTELAVGLIDFVVEELDGDRKARAEARPVVRFIAERIASPLADATFR